MEIKNRHLSEVYSSLAAIIASERVFLLAVGVVFVSVSRVAEARPVYL